MSAASGATLPARLRWRSWLLPALLGVAAVLLVLVTVSNQSLQNERPYDLNSVAPEGLRALRLWLREMGYTVTMPRGHTFAPPQDADLLLIYPGVKEWSVRERHTLRQWVSAGGAVAVIAPQDEAMLDFLMGGGSLDFAASQLGGTPIRQMQPLLPASPAMWGSDFGIYDFRLNPISSMVPVLSSQGYSDGQTLAVQQRDAGTIWYASDFHALTNHDLRDSRNVAVMAAILRTVPDGGSIAFDAYHLYGPETEMGETEELVTLQDWLYDTAGGRALLFAIAVGALYWLLAGRRLGPPLPAQRNLRRREGAEYVRAMAGLKRRARTSAEVAQHQRQRLKIALGKPRHIAATLADADFINALRASGDVESAELDTIQTLLTRLRGFRNEQELVAVTAAVNDYLANS